MAADTTTWDRFYRGDGDEAPHWSGEANPALVAEVSGLAPGRALEVGCGEGADAIWLARRGWEVTAIDPSGVALDRARAAARAADVEVRWERTGLLELAADPRGYDLVTAHYGVVAIGREADAASALLGAVAPGGTLLAVHHDLDPAHAATHGDGAHALVTPAELVAHLGDGWTVEVDEVHARPRPGAAEGHAPPDVVLRARRHPTTVAPSG